MSDSPASMTRLLMQLEQERDQYREALEEISRVLQDNWPTGKAAKIAREALNHD